MVESERDEPCTEETQENGINKESSTKSTDDLQMGEILSSSINY